MSPSCDIGCVTPEFSSFSLPAATDKVTTCLLFGQMGFGLLCLRNSVAVNTTRAVEREATYTLCVAISARLIMFDRLNVVNPAGSTA